VPAAWLYFQINVSFTGESDMTLSSLRELLVDQLKDLYSAESQLVKALPKVAKGASSTSLKQALEHHLEETRGHVDRLEQIGKILNVKVSGKKCKGMEGLLEEGKEVLSARGCEATIDAGIVAAAQRVEHYEMAAYGTARALVEQLGYTDVASLLLLTLNEEKAADQKLTEVVEQQVYPEACRTEEDTAERHATAGASR
jgi:ferritin-like metal-binding protein YciE